MSHCPYCDQIVKSGGLYCSRNENIKSMADVDSGIHIIRASHIEMPEPHLTRLSLNFDLTGELGFEVSKRRYTVNPGRFLLLNAGSAYRSFLDADKPHTTAYIVFKIGLAEQVFHAMTNDHASLLDNPFPVHTSQVTFTEKTYDWERSFLLRTIGLLKSMEEGASFSVAELDDFYESLLVKMMREQLKVHDMMTSLHFEKQGTRTEIYTRLNNARDFIHDNYFRNISLADIATHACLSVHHFKRLFRDLYHVSPHQYIMLVRLQKASTLLVHSDYAVNDICTRVGFSDASSFVRLFKSRMEVTPLTYRKTYSRRRVKAVA